jgi:hypothetical protein
LQDKEKVSKRTEKGLELKGDVSAKPRVIVADANTGGGGHLTSLQSNQTDYTLPYHVIIANASGTGTRAIWESYQQEQGMAAIGQFDLKIFFRVPKKDIEPWPANGVIRDLYCVDWNLEINRKRLVDHNIDFEGNWNMKVNGRHLMDRCGSIEYEEISNGQKYPRLKYDEFWNVPIPDLPQEDLLKYKKRVYNMMIEEEPKAEEHRLLRPLYLVRDLVSISITIR